MKLNEKEHSLLERLDFILGLDRDNSNIKFLHPVIFTLLEDLSLYVLSQMWHEVTLLSPHPDHENTVLVVLGNKETKELTVEPVEINWYDKETDSWGCSEDEEIIGWKEYQI